MRRDNYQCRYCGAKAHTADHIIPRSDRGADTDANLVACCWDCQFPHRRPNPYMTEVGPGEREPDNVIELNKTPVEDVWRTPRILGKRAKVMVRRNRYADHPHPVKAGDAPDLKRYPNKYDEPQAHPTLNSRKALNRMLAVLPVDMVRSEAEIYDQHLAEGKRIAYAAMAAHKEMASVILASGGTQRQAADYAGVSVGTIGKYLQDEEFVTRVREQRELALGTIQGRIISELERRTDYEAIKSIDTAELLRIMDRTDGRLGAAASKQTTVQAKVDVNVTNYNALLADLTSDGPGEESEAFQVVRVVGPGVAGELSPGDGEVPAAGLRETDG